jgi:hypothetical protein
VLAWRNKHFAPEGPSVLLMAWPNVLVMFAQAATSLIATLLLLYKSSILCNKGYPRKITMATARHAGRRSAGTRENPRRSAVLASAKDAGLLAGASGRIAGRIRKQLVNAAKTRSGIKSDTELLEYALARVALEDDFGPKLIAREGRVPQDIDLEF